MKKCILLILLSTSNILFLHAQLNIKNIWSNTNEKIISPDEFVECNSLLFFVSSSANYGSELWVSDGNSNNTKLVKDINPGSGSSTYSLTKSSIILNNSLYFIADDGQTGGELWKTDGTTAGTIRITDTLNAKIPQLTVIGNTIFFIVIKKTSNLYFDSLQVWKSDGTKNGTMLVKKGVAMWNSVSFQGKCNNTFIYTFQQYGSNNSKVWRSDGTDTGTFPITSEIDGNGAGQGGTSSLTQYIEFNNYLYFVGRSKNIFGVNSVGIMKTDGTLTNTIPVKDLYDGNIDLTKSADVIELNNKLYFSFYESVNNRVFIYESDGTGPGTKKIYDQTGSKYFIPSNLSKNNNFLLFSANNNSGETSLFALNTTNYNTNEIGVLASNPIKPFIYISLLDACFLNAFGDQIFISVPDNNYSFDGWIYNLTQYNIQRLDTLKGVRFGYDYKNKLVYSRSVNGMSDFWLLSVEKANGIDNISISNKINIYPNPAHDFMTVYLQEKILKPIDLTIYNIQGQIVKVLQNWNESQIYIGDLSNGLYYLLIDKEGKHISLKFIKD